MLTLMRLTPLVAWSGQASSVLRCRDRWGLLLAWVLLCGLPATGYGQSRATLERLPRRAPVQLAQDVPTSDDQPTTGDEEATEPASDSTVAEGEEPSEEPLAAAEGPPAPFPGEPIGDRGTLEHADEVYYEAGAIVAKGNIVVRTEQLTVRADVVEIDENKEWATFRGNVVLETENQTTTAEELLINLETEQWEMRRGRTKVEPEFFEEGQVLDPLFAGGRQVTSDAEGDLIKVFKGSLTSCNKHQPHYSIRSKDIQLRRERKVVINDPAFYIGSTRIMWLPFRLVASLAEKKNRFMPELGQNNVEGYFAKVAYMYLAGQTAEGLLRLHLTQKRGIGLGVDHSIFDDRQDGEGSIFFEPSQGAMTSRVQHRYQLSPRLQSSLRGSLQRRSGYFGSTSSESADLTFRYSDSNTGSHLGFQRSLTRSSYSTSRRFTTNFRFNQTITPQERWNLQANMRRNSVRAGEATDEELDARFEYERQLSHFDWHLRADKRYDLDGSAYTGDKYFGLHRLPELTFRTDTRRLDGWKLLGRMPVNSTVQVGRYSQDPDDIEVIRGAIDTRFPGRERRLTGNARLRASGRFLQAFYGDGSAQYITALNTDLRQRWGGHWESQLRYSFQSRHGFAPIRIDYAGRRHDLHFRAVRVKRDRSRIELSTGFDFIGDRWRDVLLRTEYMPTSESKLELQSGYSLQYSRWRPLSLRFRQVHLPRFYLALGTEYDLDRSELSRATMELDWVLHPKWQIELLTGYSGYRNDFDTLDVELTRDFHCWIASVAYSKQLDEFRLNLALKAFPSPERILGIGRQGTRFQSLPGQYF